MSKRPAPAWLRSGVSVAWVAVAVIRLVGKTIVTLGNGIKVAVGDSVAVIVIGIAVGSVGAMKSSVGVSGTGSLGPGVTELLMIDVAFNVAVPVSTVTGVRVAVSEEVTVGEPDCNMLCAFRLSGVRTSLLCAPLAVM